MEKEEKKGPTGIWTRIAGFKVRSANHYTIRPSLAVYVSSFSPFLHDECRAPYVYFSVREQTNHYLQTNTECRSICTKLIEKYAFIEFSERNFDQKNKKRTKREQKKNRQKKALAARLELATYRLTVWRATSCATQACVPKERRIKSRVECIKYLSNIYVTTVRRTKEQRNKWTKFIVVLKKCGKKQKKQNRGIKWRTRVSIPVPRACKARTLPIELDPQQFIDCCVVRAHENVESLRALKLPMKLIKPKSHKCTSRKFVTQFSARRWLSVCVVG